MIEAYKKFWVHYVDFTGKSTRADFWWYVLCNAIIFAILYALLAIIGLGAVGAGSAGSSAGATGLGVFIVILLVVAWGYGIASLIPGIALSVRRLRDGGFPWGLIFLAFIPLAGGIALLIMYCMPSKPDTVSDQPANMQ